MKIEAAMFCNGAQAAEGLLFMLGAGFEFFTAQPDRTVHLVVAGIFLHEDGDTTTPVIQVAAAQPDGEACFAAELLYEVQNVGTAPRRRVFAVPVHFVAPSSGMYTVTVSLETSIVTLPLRIV